MISNHSVSYIASTCVCIVYGLYEGRIWITMHWPWTFFLGACKANFLIFTFTFPLCLLKFLSTYQFIVLKISRLSCAKKKKSRFNWALEREGDDEMNFKEVNIDCTIHRLKVIGIWCLLECCCWRKVLRILIDFLKCWIN